MICKYYIKKIKEELGDAMSYNEMAKTIKEKDPEASKYLAKLAEDSYSSAGILTKLLEEHVDKETTGETYSGVYKELFKMYMENIKEDYEEASHYLKKA